MSSPSFLFLFLLLALTSPGLIALADDVERPDIPPPCPPCQPDKCPEVGQCEIGVVRDRCGCCSTCGLGEAHLCNLDDDNDDVIGPSIWHGRCGDNLECRPRQDIDVELVGTQSICYCLLEGQVCGSDNITYSKCQMQGASSDGDVFEVYDGPCRRAPSITLDSPKKAIKRGENLAVTCEARGFPRPTITWKVDRLDTKMVEQDLPGDHPDVSITTPGAPSLTQTISYLQVTNFQRELQGRYFCTASNELGRETGTAILILREGSLDD